MVMIGFWIVFAAVFFGLTYGLLQICTERTIVRRERLVGLRLGAYVASKVTVLVPFLLVVIVAMLGRPARCWTAYLSRSLFDVRLDDATSLLLCAGRGARHRPAHLRPRSATVPGWPPSRLPMLCFPAVLFSSGPVLPGELHGTGRRRRLQHGDAPRAGPSRPSATTSARRRILAARWLPMLDLRCSRSYGDAGTASTGTYYLILGSFAVDVPARDKCGRAHQNHPQFDPLTEPCPPPQGMKHMMTDSSIEIDAPARPVRDVFVAVERWLRTASVQRIVPLDGGAIEVGNRFEIKQPRPPKLTWEVIEVDPGVSWTWCQRPPGATTCAPHQVVSLGPGTDARTAAHPPARSCRSRGWCLDAETTKRYLALEARGPQSAQRRIATAMHRVDKATVALGRAL